MAQRGKHEIVVVRIKCAVAVGAASPPNGQVVGGTVVATVPDVAVGGSKASVGWVGGGQAVPGRHHDERTSVKAHRYVQRWRPIPVPRATAASREMAR